MSYFLYNNKKVFYKECGAGQPLIIIHGNSVSSRMHNAFAKKLAKYFRVISLDLPGHGRSERVEEWPVDFWYENGNVVAALIGELGLSDVALLGYSGGAQIALNVALEHRDLVSTVVADSFEGESSVASYAENIFEERAKDAKKILAKIFWFLMHGRDWKKVVTNDSKVIYEHHKQLGNFFHKDLSALRMPVLLTGSKQDEYISNIEQIYAPLAAKIPDTKTVIYEQGKHPASLTVGEAYIDDLIGFIGVDAL